MGTTQPIRDKDELKNFIAYYEVAHPNIRNYTMIILGALHRIAHQWCIEFKMERCVLFWERLFLRSSSDPWTENRKGQWDCLKFTRYQSTGLLPENKKTWRGGLYFFKTHHTCASALPFPGISYCTQSSGRNLMRNACQLSFAPQDVWLSCMETGNFAGSSDGSV